MSVLMAVSPPSGLPGGSQGPQGKPTALLETNLSDSGLNLGRTPGTLPG